MMLGLGVALGFGGTVVYPAPTISAVSPAVQAVSGGTVTLTGTNFVAGVTTFALKNGGSTYALTGVSVTNSTTATATVPAGVPLSTALGTYSVTATNSGQTATLAGAYDSWDFVSAGWSTQYASVGASASQWTDQNTPAHNYTQSDGTKQPVPEAGPPKDVAFAGNKAYERDDIMSADALGFFLVFKWFTLPGNGSFQSLVTITQTADKKFFEAIACNNMAGYTTLTMKKLFAGAGATVGFNFALQNTTAIRLGLGAKAGGSNTDSGQYMATLNGVSQTISNNAGGILSRTATDIGSLAARVASSHAVSSGFAGYVYMTAVKGSAPTVAELQLADAYAVANVPVA